MVCFGGPFSEQWQYWTVTIHTGGITKLQYGLFFSSMTPVDDRGEGSSRSPSLFGTAEGQEELYFQPFF